MTQRFNPETGKEYFNHYDPLKLYHDILFNSGRNVQQRELNELLAMSANRVKQLGAVLYNDGALVHGGGTIINGTTVKVLAADIYVAGIVHSLPTVDLTIIGVGTEIIGVKLTQEITTYLQDSDLLDPTPGVNYGRPGADRLKITPTWVVNDPDAFPIYVLQDGQIKKEKYAPESDSIEAWLARRTNDESGSYTVSGLTGSVFEQDADNLLHVVEAGTGYVTGWEIRKPSPVKQLFPKSKTTLSVTNETKTYNTGTNDYILNSQPAKQITLVTAQVQKTFSMTRGASSNGTDAIPVQYTPVTSIDSISGYTANTDYTLSGNNVSWAPGGSEPANGATYSITVTYTKTMVLGTDCQLTTDGNNQSVVRFLSGDKPVNGSNFQVNYDFYLERRDLFYLDKNGDIKIVLGTPGIVAPLPPYPIGVLILGDMYLPPNSANVVVNNYDPKRLTMSEIRVLRDRIDRLEYNIAIEDLDDAASEMDPATNKKGIFTDGFLNMNKIDFGISGVACSINPDEGKLLSDFTATPKDLSANNTGTAKIWENCVTKQYTEVIGAQQRYATQLMNINQYQVFTKKVLVSVTPNQDNWVITDTKLGRVFGWWDQNWGNLLSDPGVTVAKRLIVDEAVPFIRQRTLTLTGTNFFPLVDNIKATFDGIPVVLTVGEKGTAGTQTGTVKADINGEFIATFLIPNHVPCGTREITIWSEG